MVNDEEDVATQFMGFWKNFINTFNMQGFKIYGMSIYRSSADFSHVYIVQTANTQSSHRRELCWHVCPIHCVWHA